MGVDDALEKYADEFTVVIVSWMPQGVDWTEKIRRKRVKGYILIGEMWDGCCGDNWLTWGNAKFKAESPRQDSIEEELPMHERDGYEMKVCEEASKHQISRYCTADARLSKTARFLRLNTTSACTEAD